MTNDQNDEALEALEYIQRYSFPYNHGGAQQAEEDAGGNWVAFTDVMAVFTEPPRATNGRDDKILNQLKDQYDRLKKYSDELSENFDKNLCEAIDLLRENKALKAQAESEGVDELREEKRMRRLAQINFEHYFNRYITITGKSIDEAEEEWARATNNGQEFPSALTQQREAVPDLLALIVSADALINEAEATFSEADFEMHYTGFADKHADLFNLLYTLKKKYTKPAPPTNEEKNDE